MQRKSRRSLKDTRIHVPRGNRYFSWTSVDSDLMFLGSNAACPSLNAPEAPLQAYPLQNLESRPISRSLSKRFHTFNWGAIKIIRFSLDRNSPMQCVHPSCEAYCKYASYLGPRLARVGRRSRSWPSSAITHNGIVDSYFLSRSRS